MSKFDESYKLSDSTFSRNSNKNKHKSTKLKKKKKNCKISDKEKILKALGQERGHRRAKREMTTDVSPETS